MYLPGPRDRTEWVEQLCRGVALLNRSPTGMQFALFDGASPPTTADPSIGDFWAGGGLRSMLRGDDGALEAVRAWARDSEGCPVRALTRVLADGRPTGTTGACHLAALRATTGPDVEPVYVVHTWTPPAGAHTPASSSWPTPDDSLLVLDADSVVRGRSANLPIAHGLVGYLTIHPEDVATAVAAATKVPWAGIPRGLVRIRGFRAWIGVHCEAFPLTGNPSLSTVVAVRNRPADPDHQLADPAQRLSPREAEVFRALIAAKPASLIAEELSVAPSTVRNLTSRVLHKLEVTDRSALLRRFSPRSHDARPSRSLTLGFEPGRAAARAMRPVFVDMTGDRSNWVEAIGQTLLGFVTIRSKVGVALIDHDQLLVTNPAFDAWVGSAARGRSLFEFADADTVKDHAERAGEIAGVWSFRQLVPGGLMTVSVVPRRSGEDAAVILYLQCPDTASDPGPDPQGWLLVDRGWRIVAGGLVGSAASPHTLGVGNVVWPMIHPASLPQTIEHFERAWDSDGPVEFANDTLRMTGWRTGLNRLRRLDGDPAHLFWEFSRPFATFTNAPDPARLSQLSARDLPMGIAALEGDDVAALADRFGLAAGTVRNRLSSIYRTLGVRNRAEFMARYR